MGKETASRIQTSIVNAAEKKILIWLANRQPRWMTSDMLTFIGVLGSMICALGYILSNRSLHYLWLSSLGLVINWYGDSLDGTLARVRKASRPIYGFFIDHTLDAIAITFMCIGAGLSPMFRLDVSLLVLVGYLVLSIYTYICAILKDEFNLTYGCFGPTEFRIVVILLNTLIIFLPWQRYVYEVDGERFGILDIVALIIAFILFVLYWMQFIKDRRAFALQDPLKSPDTENEK